MPTHDGGMLAGTYKALRHLEADLAEHKIKAEVCAPVRGSVLPNVRQATFDQAMDSGAEFILTIDSDMHFPPWAARHLIAHDKDCITGMYFMKTPPYNCAHAMWDTSELDYRTIGMPDSPDELITVDAIGAGFLMVRAQVLKGIEKPWFRFWERGVAKRQQGEDYYFCKKLTDAGKKIHVDPSLQLGHITDSVVTYRDHVMWRTYMSVRQKAGITEPPSKPEMQGLQFSAMRAMLNDGARIHRPGD